MVQLTYLGGHPDLPESHLVNIKRQRNQIVLYSKDILYSYNKPIARIPLSAVKSIRLERASSRSLGKAAVGAIAGAVLLGPVGAIAGGALGGRKRKESLIVVTSQDGPVEFEILFGGKNAERDYPKFAQLFKDRKTKKRPRKRAPKREPKKEPKGGL